MEGLNNGTDDYKSKCREHVVKLPELYSKRTRCLRGDRKRRMGQQIPDLSKTERPVLPKPLLRIRKMKWRKIRR